METAMVGKTYGPQTMFKSYYVVWKLKYIYDKEKKKNTV